MTPEQYFNKYGRLMPEKVCRKEKKKMSFNEIMESDKLTFLLCLTIACMIVGFFILIASL